MAIVVPVSQAHSGLSSSSCPHVTKLTTAKGSGVSVRDSGFWDKGLAASATSFGKHTLPTSAKHLSQHKVARSPMEMTPEIQPTVRWKLFKKLFTAAVKNNHACKTRPAISSPCTKSTLSEASPRARNTMPYLQGGGAARLPLSVPG